MRWLGITLFFSVSSDIASSQPSSAHTAAIKVNVEEVSTSQSGRWVRIQGQVLTREPTSPRRLYLYHHSDVFYQDGLPLSMAADGSFLRTTFVSHRVDRLELVLVSHQVDLSSQPNCESGRCRGRLDPRTGRVVAQLVDHVDIIAAATFAPYPNPAQATAETFFERQLSNDAVFGPFQPAALVRSGLETDAFFLYDQALAAIALIRLNRLPAASTILNALANLQMPDGSWYFMYRADGTTPYSSTLDYRYAGAIAWAVSAFNTYHLTTGELAYRNTVERALSHLAAQLVEAGEGLAVQFNPSDLVETPWDERAVTSVEHAVDTLAAFHGHSVATGKPLPASVRQIERYVRSRQKPHHFEAGYHLVSGANIAERYLDVLTWSALAMHWPAPSLSDMFAQACDWHSTERAFHSDAPDRQKRNGSAMWLEGTLGWVVAAQYAAPWVKCRGKTWREWLAVVEASVDPFGGLPEFQDEARGSGLSQSTAATAWLVFARTAFNPFQPWRHLKPFSQPAKTGQPRPSERQ
jgi:hypothetical protein